jgi:UDP-N-acetylglucosamine--N-acetylmuramyl-(pentapeptide) pyrophosphoryl-undecaprenol N-acetylglucosamine transferase
VVANNSSLITGTLDTGILKTDASTAHCRVLIMAGGTGGHVFPALAVADQLRGASASVAWLGTQRGIESELVPDAGIPLNCIDIEGIRGRGLSALLKAPLLLWRSIRQALTVLSDFKPQVVLGMGGFASGPGAVAARLKGIPIVIHEQNSVAGTTNRLVSRIAQRVMQGFPGTLANGEWCGNPVRPSIANLAPPQQRLADRDGAPRLLVLGGSRGALAINQILPAALALIDPDQRPEVRHQTGKQHSEQTQALYAAAGVSAEVVPFIGHMDEAYGWADFAICRAGALTVAELTSAGLGSLLIPFPFAIDDHQTVNGQLLVDQGAALMQAQADLTPTLLAEQIKALCGDSERRMQMAVNARELAKAGAAERVADVCLEIANA